MNKILLIISREYLTRVRKKSFLLTTILVPIIIIGFYAAIIAIAVSDSEGEERIAVIDKSGLFTDSIPDEKDDGVKLELVTNETEESFKNKYSDKGYAGYVYIPQLNIDTPAGIKLHSRSSLNIATKNKVERKIDKAIENKKLLNANIDPAKYASIKTDVSIESTIDSEAGEKKSVKGAAEIAGFASGILIYMVLLIYGTMVMRGVMEEKTNRISEVIVSSVKPFQLMFGKIIGIGAVGLTQFVIWIVLISVLQLVLSMVMPGLAEQMASQAGNTGPAAAVAQARDGNVMASVSEGLDSLPIGLLVFSFLFYFIGGYIMYAALFAAIGSVSEDQQDAQQLIFPVMMPIILGFVIMMKAVQNPDGGLALFGSMFPLTSPIVMMARIPFGVPAWQLLASMALLILFFLFCTWLAGRIYRVGILMYGKKGSWKEMVKWAFRNQ